MSNKVIMGNMADLVVRELWGAYEHEHKQRVMQLIRVVGCYSEPLLFVEASQTQPWVILHLNEAAVTVTGTSLPLTFAGVTARDACPIWSCQKARACRETMCVAVVCRSEAHQCNQPEVLGCFLRH